MNKEAIYKIIFFLGYLSILVVTFVPVFGNLSSIKFGPDAFKIRLDFLLHSAAYFIICFYYLFGYKSGFKLFKSKALAKFIFLMILLSIVTEITQIWVPSRTFNVFDLVSNLLGIILGLIFIKIAGLKRA